MRATLAIVGDTWRQSRQQVVFILMAVLLLLIAAGAIIMPKPMTDADGKQAFGMIWADTPTAFFSQAWVGAYQQTLQTKREATPDLPEKEDGTLDHEAWNKQQEEQQALRRKAVAAATGLSDYQLSVEMWINFTISLMFTFSMWLFIAASAGYFPGLLEQGAVDCVLAKPLSRAKIYFGKYLGGLALFSGAIGLFSVVLFVGIGLRLGVWHLRIFYCMPLLIFCAALLYAFLALIGVFTRSTPLSILLGYFLYIVVDLAFTAIRAFQQAGMFERWNWLDKLVERSRYVLPNFLEIKGVAVSFVLNMPKVDWTPFMVGGGWLVGSLLLGYWWFRRSDY